MRSSFRRRAFTSNSSPGSHCMSVTVVAPSSSSPKRCSASSFLPVCSATLAINRRSSQRLRLEVMPGRFCSHASAASVPSLSARAKASVSSCRMSSSSTAGAAPSVCVSHQPVELSCTCCWIQLSVTSSANGVPSLKASVSSPVRRERNPFRSAWIMAASCSRPDLTSA